ncbi:MAG: hypothetical protein RR147_00845 [Oscillospiraceae bacterium]
MADILELSAQYRISGCACKKKLFELKNQLRSESLNSMEEIELRRRITMLTAMSRDCIATSNYLKTYFERRERLERNRKQKAGI